MFESLFLELEGDPSWLLGGYAFPLLMKGAYARGVSRRACEGAEEPVWGRRRGLWVYVGPAALGPNLLAGLCRCPLLRQVKSARTMC